MKKIFAALAALVGALALTFGTALPAQAAPASYTQNACDTNEIALQYVGVVDGARTWSVTNRSADARDYMLRFSDGGAWKATQYHTIGAGQTINVASVYTKSITVVNGEIVYTNDSHTYVRVYPGDATVTLSGATKAGCDTLTGTSAWATTTTTGGNGGSKGKGNR